MKQVMKEAVRQGIININPIQQVEPLSKKADKDRRSLSIDKMVKRFPIKDEEALAIWRERKYLTLTCLLVSSGMRSGEVRALRWSDVLWEDRGIIITKAMKNSGKVGKVKEQKEKMVCLPERTIAYLRAWKGESL